MIKGSLSVPTSSLLTSSNFSIILYPWSCNERCTFVILPLFVAKQSRWPYILAQLLLPKNQQELAREHFAIHAEEERAKIPLQQLRPHLNLNSRQQ
jgi:hypothetical protein